MGNNFFKTTHFDYNNEATLYADGTNEVIQTRGIDMFYLPRTRLKDDFIFGEASASEFTSNKPITFYIENYSDFEGAGEIFSKFGFVPDRQLTLLSEVRDFRSITGQDPDVGDLIYYPASLKIFEIVHATPVNYFYQFHHTAYTFKITCKLFEYSHEKIDVNLEEVDIINGLDSQTDEEYTMYDEGKDEILDLTESDIFGNL